MTNEETRPLHEQGPGSGAVDDDQDDQKPLQGNTSRVAESIANYLDWLAIEDHEHIGMLWIHGDQRNTAVVLRDAVPAIAEHQIPDECNAYLAPNPVAGPVRINKGRGTEEQVTRIAAIFADLDVKQGACESIEAAHQIIDEISARIEERPTVVIFSGGGLQPIWVLEDCSPEVGRPLLRRFGRLVKAVGQERNTKLDSVFDSARVLRIPRSLNHKYGDPIEVSAIPDTGGPIVPATLAERLDEWGVAEEDSDTKAALGEVVSPDSQWRYAIESCGYSHTTIESWMSEPVSERHPWLLCCLTRLECMRRNGCLTHADYTAALRNLEQRFAALCATQEPRRSPKRYEVRDLHNVAVDRASRKTQRELDLELGGVNGHVHLAGQAPMLSLPVDLEDAAEEQSEGNTRGTAAIRSILDAEGGFWSSRPSLTRIYETSLARMCSPWAVLAHCAARALALVRPNATLPALIGGPGSLNWFGAIAASSGGGKGAAGAVARELVPGDFPVRNAGSGEGMIEAFGRKPTEENDADHHEAVLFNANEVDTLAALGQRTGSTMMTVIREGFSGEALGFSYKSSRKPIEAHAYRMTLTVSVQPGRAGFIIGDADGGTPQRFQWFPGIDPRVDEDSQWLSQPLPLALPDHTAWRYPRTIQIPDEVARFIRREHARRARGDGDALDGHAVFVREKFAFALAVLDGRHGITEEDWELSGIAAEVSKRTRDWVAAGLAHSVRRDSERQGEQLGHRMAAANAARADAEERDRNRVALWVLDKLRAAGATGMLLSELKQARKQGRNLLPGVLESLRADGLVRSETVTGGGRPGERWWIVL